MCSLPHVKSSLCEAYCMRNLLYVESILSVIMRSLFQLCEYRLGSKNNYITDLVVAPKQGRARRAADHDIFVFGRCLQHGRRIFLQA